MTATLPYPTAAPARESGQTDAKDATGRPDATRFTRGGVPVGVNDPAGPIWLVTVQRPDGQRRAWMIGSHAPVTGLATLLGWRYEAQRCTVIDELLTDEEGQV